MKHECFQETLLREMSGDIKTLVAEFRAMNGSLRETKLVVEKHETESKPYQKKVDMLWTTLHTLKYAVVLLFGTGFVWKIWEMISR